MSTEQQRFREEYWKGHISSWKRSSLEIRAYCQEQGISHNTFYYWRKRLSSRFPARQLPIASRASSFVPVEIATEATSGVSVDLPDAKWLGEFVSELIRGLR